MFALARIGVFVQMGAVEIAQAVPVAWEMGGDPIEDDADAVLMERIHQKHEIVRRAEAAGRREIADGLIAPGAVERMLR